MSAIFLYFIAVFFLSTTKYARKTNAYVHMYRMDGLGFPNYSFLFSLRSEAGGAHKYASSAEYLGEMDENMEVRFGRRGDKSSSYLSNSSRNIVIFSNINPFRNHKIVSN